MKALKFCLAFAACLLGASVAKAEPIWQLYVDYPCSSQADTTWFTTLVGNGTTQSNAYAEWGGAGPVPANPTTYPLTVSGRCYGLLTWLPNSPSWSNVNAMSPTGNCPGTPSSSNPCAPTIAQIIADFEANISPPSGQTWGTTDITIPSAGTSNAPDSPNSQGPEYMLSDGYAWASGWVCRYAGDVYPSC